MVIDAHRFQWAGTQVIIGWNTMNLLPQVLGSPRRRQKILLMHGRSAMEKLGCLQRLKKLLKNHSLHWFGGISPNPTFSDCDLALGIYRRLHPDVLVAIGGGSVLDLAKVTHGAGPLRANARNVRPELDRAVIRSSKLIVIPTTAGTGSEVTPFSAIWDFEEGKKYSLDHPRLLPDVAIVDPDLSRHMNARLAALTGADAFSHAIESLWSKRKTPLSRALASEALSKIHRVLPAIVHSRSRSASDYLDMAWGSVLAGMAISLTRTALSHAISYPLTAHRRVPHGQAVCVTLPAVFNLARPGLGKDADHIAALLGRNRASDVPAALKSFLRRIGLAVSLEELGITKKDLSLIADQSYSPGRSDNLCVKVTRNGISRILNSTWKKPS